MHLAAVLLAAPRTPQPCPRADIRLGLLDWMLAQPAQSSVEALVRPEGWDCTCRMAPQDDNSLARSITFGVCFVMDAEDPPSGTVRLVAPTRDFSVEAAGSWEILTRPDDHSVPIAVRWRMPTSEAGRASLSLSDEDLHFTVALGQGDGGGLLRNGQVWASLDPDGGTRKPVGTFDLSPNSLMGNN